MMRGITRYTYIVLLSKTNKARGEKDLILSIDMKHLVGVRMTLGAIWHQQALLPRWPYEIT